MDYRVHKFGGTSLASAEHFKNAASIILKQDDTHRAVVLSAVAGITDSLIQILELAKAGKGSYTKIFNDVKAKHQEIASQLLNGTHLTKIMAEFNSDWKNIGKILKTTKSTDISGYGELWSANIFNSYLLSTGIGSKLLDARKVLFVHKAEMGIEVDWTLSKRKFRGFMSTVKPDTRILVITGYIASTKEGKPTTLGRNGSDYSASIFGSLLKASSITIWKDVDGVFSADPEKVSNAVCLSEISYQEAMEIAYFGAKVIHPRALVPAIENNIPVFIKNSSNPDHPGTKIADKKNLSSGTEDGKFLKIVKGFSTIDNLSLINLEGAGMIGISGVSERLFSALKNEKISVVMISQAGSEHSICFAVPSDQGETALEATKKTFNREIKAGIIHDVTLVGSCSLLAAVGDRMVNTPGVASKFFGALGKAGVNVKAIAQGSSERNISAVIDTKDSVRALRAVHSGFYLSNQTLSVGVIGPGLIGRTLLSQLKEQKNILRDKFNIDIHVRGIINTKKMLLSDKSVDLSKWQKDFDERSVKYDLKAFVNNIQSENFPHAVIIDCTSSEEISSNYIGWLERGINIITPNKKANSSSYDTYKKLQKLGQGPRTHFLYEANVGAGLPVITTLRDLIQTGDKIISIEGVLSGTLSYIFNSFTPDKTFSESVRAAKEKGYTEPNPMDDLNGMDVARKLIILAREAGFELELKDVEVESLVPEGLRGCKDPNEFLNDLPKYDKHMSDMISRAISRSEVLRHVGTISQDGKASVTLKSYPASHYLSKVSGSDNIIAFTTERYKDRPLIIQGPGAGPDVTAAGVFADLLRLASYVGGGA